MNQEAKGARTGRAHVALCLRTTARQTNSLQASLVMAKALWPQGARGGGAAQQLCAGIQLQHLMAERPDRRELISPLITQRCTPSPGPSGGIN